MLFKKGNWPFGPNDELLWKIKKFQAETVCVPKEASGALVSE
jgi:hypothetical protein